MNLWRSRRWNSCASWRAWRKKKRQKPLTLVTTLFLAGSLAPLNRTHCRSLIFAAYINASLRISFGQKPSSKRTMREYNGFSSNERAKVGKLQLEAVRAGKLPKPSKCELCGSTEGQLQLHNEDYSKPFDDAHPISRSCHLHCMFVLLIRNAGRSVRSIFAKFAVQATIGGRSWSTPRSILTRYVSVVFSATL